MTFDCAWCHKPAAWACIDCMTFMCDECQDDDFGKCTAKCYDALPEVVDIDIVKEAHEKAEVEALKIMSPPGDKKYKS